MVVKFKIYFLVSVIIAVGCFFFFDFEERLNLVGNKIIYVNNSNLKLDNLNVSFCGSNTEIIIKNGILKNTKFSDWYGKEYILFSYGDIQEKHFFNEYKFDSWRKVKYYLTISLNSDKNLVFDWCIKSDLLPEAKGTIIKPLDGASLSK